MSWADAVPVMLVAVAVLFWPAPLLLATLRFPPLASVAAAPAIGVLVLVSSAIIADVAGLSWGWPWVLATALVLMAGLAFARWVVRRGAPPDERSLPSPRILLTYLAGITGAGLAFGPHLFDALVSPTAFSQRFDNVFHLNATHLASTGQASPFDLEPLTANFYPAVWHEWGAIVIQVTGADVRTATQACIVATVLVLWPLTMAWLVETIVQPGVTGRLILGPLALSSVSFPLALAAWGPLYPNLLGLALTPVLLAAGWDALGRRDQPTLGLGSALTVVALGGVAVALTHPNALLSAGLFLLPVAVAALWPLIRRRDRRSIRGSRPWAVAVAGFVVLLPLAWYVLGSRIAQASLRQPFTTLDRAFIDVVLGTSLTRPPVPSLTIGLVTGLLVAAFVPRLRALLVSFALASAIYMAAATMETSPGMLLVTAPYYTDPYRIAAAGTLVVIPLAVLGWDTAASILGERLPERARLVLAVALAVALAIVAPRSDGLRSLHDEVRTDFTAGADARVLTADELTLIERLPQTTEPGATLVVNPYQGGSLAFALAGRSVTDYYMYTEPSPAARYLAGNLRHASTVPAVCAAVAETGARYVLVLEPDEIPAPPGTESFHQGLRGLDEAPGFERVDAEGAAALYRITACG